MGKKGLHLTSVHEVLLSLYGHNIEYKITAFVFSPVKLEFSATME